MATSLSHSQVGAHFDRAARVYLLALKAGQRPPERPNMGPRWEPLVSVVERAYNRSHGALDAVERTMQSLCVTNPDLAELLRDPLPLPPAAVIEHVTDRAQMSPLPEAAQLPEELSRGACSELDEMYVPYSLKASPEAWPDYHPFCGLWGFSTVAARRVYLQLGPKKFYTNVMFILSGRTTLTAKTETADIGKRMITEAGLGHLLLADRLSPQKLLSDMAGSFVPANYGGMDPSKQERTRRRLAMPGQRGWFYDEFGKFVQSMLRKGSNMADFAELFLRLDRCPDEYENATLSRGAEPIEHPYLTLLGTMTPSNVRDSARSGAEFWQDGFWARFSFLCSPADFLETNTWGMDPLPIPETLKQALQTWHDRLGEPYCDVDAILGKDDEPTGKYTITRSELTEHACTLTQDAYQGYNQYRIALRSMIATSKNQDFDGNYGRLPETAMRMAVIMASLSNNNRIEIRHWARAQELAEVLRKNLHELYNQVNAPAVMVDKTAQLEHRIIDILQKRAAAGEPALTVNKINTSYLKNHDISNDAVERTLRGLQRAGVVEMIPTKKSKFYKLVDSNDVEDEDHAEDMTIGLEEIGGIEGWE